MKKLMFSIATLIILAGSTFSAVSAVHYTSMASVIKPKTTSPRPTGPTPDSIPPCCPLNDPNGCGIYD